MSARPIGHPLVRAGTVIDGRYKVIGLLGEGGAGLVLEAEQLSVGRRVALKILRLDRWSEDATKRFAREAHALGRVQSPRVLQVLEQGNDRDIGPYLVTELSHGEMLSSRLQREGAISTGDFMVLARALVEALRDVHSVGLLHRDIKPSNIALPESGPIAAKLLDFGLATGVDPHAFSRLTKTDDVVGSLPYVAPEIFDGEGATVQSDIWSLGIVFYEMLSGQRPFKGESSASLMKSILSHEVNWERLPSDLPEGVVTLLKRMLARDLEARPQDCAELLACLYYPGMPGFEESDWSQQHAAPSRPILALVAGALAGALLCALGFVLSGWLAGSDAPAETIEMISHEATRNQAPEHVTTQAAASVETTKSPSSDLPLENSAAKPTQEVPDQSENKAREPSSDPVTKSTRTTLHPGSARRDRKSFQARATKKARTEENLEGDKPSAEPSWQGGVIEDYP